MRNCKQKHRIKQLIIIGVCYFVYLKLTWLKKKKSNLTKLFVGEDSTKGDTCQEKVCIKKVIQRKVSSVLLQLQLVDFMFELFKGRITLKHNVNNTVQMASHHAYLITLWDISDTAVCIFPTIFHISIQVVASN